MPIAAKRVIVFVSAGSSFYGAERVLFEVVKSLHSLYEVHIILPAEGGFSKKLEEVPGVTLHFDSFPLMVVKPLNMLRLLMQLPRLLLHYDKLFKRIGAEVVYVNGMSSLAMALVGRLLRCKTVCHIHDRNGAKADGWVYAFVVKSCCDKALFISRYVQYTYLEKFPSIRSKSRVVYNGVDVGRFSEDGSAALSAREGGVTFLVVARLEAQKNITDAIYALEKIVRRGCRARLLIVGEGSKRAELSDIIKTRGLTDAVELTGYSDTVEQFYRRCDVVLCPFVGEGFGLVAVEAMAAKKPVIAAADGGLMEIFEDGKSGFFYSPGDTDALASKMELLADAELRALMGADGEKRVLSLFTQEHQNQAIGCELDALLRVGL